MKLYNHGEGLYLWPSPDWLYYCFHNFKLREGLFAALILHVLQQHPSVWVGGAAPQWQGWLLISVGSRGRVTAVAIWQSVGHLPDLVAAARPGNASNTSSNTRTL